MNASFQEESKIEYKFIFEEKSVKDLKKELLLANHEIRTLKAQVFDLIEGKRLLK